MTEFQREIKRKKRVIEYAEKNGNIKTACRRFGIARSTFYLWRDRYRESGDEGLKSRKFGCRNASKSCARCAKNARARWPRMSPSGPGSERIVALAGGVGAARFLSGLSQVVPPDDVTAIVNTGDDHILYGVHVSPDVDIVTYTLAGRVDQRRGYGIEGDTSVVIDTLGALGHETWFRLGDRDFAHCQHRTCRIQQGMGLCEITDELRRAFGVQTRILPMSEDPCPTVVELGGGRRVHFEEYLARDGAPDDVEAVDLSAAARAQPGPGVLEAIVDADVILLCPSNPIVSIGPILALPGVRDAIRDARAPVVAVCPIVGGVPVKGPADRLLRGLGVEVSARGVAGLYADFIDGFVMDTRDAAESADVEAMGLHVRCTQSLMREPGAAAALARGALELARAST